MAIQTPNLKRVNVSSLQELNVWLDKNDGCDGSIMLVTSTKANQAKYISHEQVNVALSEHGWVSTMRYTLNKTLIGHVIRKH